MNRAGRIALLMVCAVAVFGAGVIALLVLRSVSDDTQTAREQVTTVKKDASTAKHKATVNDRKVSKVAKTADRADARSKGTVRFLQGKQGSPGIPGVNGSPGRPGARGLQGPPGKDAVFPFDRFVDAVSAKLAPQLPTSEDVLKACADACVGPQGERGPQGETGKPGPQGDIGSPGPQGIQGPPILSWTFTDATGQTQTCTDPEGDLTYACTVTG